MRGRHDVEHPFAVDSRFRTNGKAIMFEFRRANCMTLHLVEGSIAEAAKEEFSVASEMVKIAVQFEQGLDGQTRH